jgi:hypothetical protein
MTYMTNRLIKQGQYLVGLASKNISKMKYDYITNCYNYYKYVPPGAHSYYFATEKEIAKNKYTNM